MFGLLLGPLQDFLLDDSGIDAISARFEEFVLHLPEHSVIPCLDRIDALGVAFRKTAFQDLKATCKRETYHPPVSLWA